MKLRYIKCPTNPFMASRFNPSACCPDEVLTGDDSAFVTELEAFIEATGEWKNLGQALRDHDVITDNHNQRFFEPQNVDDRERGYTYP